MIDEHMIDETFARAHERRETPPQTTNQNQDETPLDRLRKSVTIDIESTNDKLQENTYYGNA